MDQSDQRSCRDQAFLGQLGTTLQKHSSSRAPLWWGEVFISDYTRAQLFCRSSSSSSSSSFSFCSIFPSSSSSSSFSTHIPFSLLLLFLLSLLNREPSLKHFDENHSFIFPLIYQFTHSIYSITSTNIYWSPTACLVLSFLSMSQWTYLNLSLVDQDLSVPKAELHPGASFVSCRYWGLRRRPHNLTWKVSSVLNKSQPDISCFCCDFHFSPNKSTWKIHQLNVLISQSLCWF